MSSQMNDPEARFGVDYLNRHRPAWSYLPGLARVWESGFGVGYGAARAWTDAHAGS